MLPWIFHESLAIIVEFIYIALIAAAFVGNNEYNNDLLLLLLLMKIILQSNPFFIENNIYSESPNTIFSSSAFRIYVYMGIWTLYKQYRVRRTASIMSHEVIIRNQEV